MEVQNKSIFSFSTIVGDTQFSFNVSGCANEMEARAKLIGQLAEVAGELKKDQEVAAGSGSQAGK